MGNIKQIIECIDAYLIREGKEVCTPPEANEELSKRGILRDSKSRKGRPLRELLRNECIPHAYKVGRLWYIPKSK